MVQNDERKQQVKDSFSLAYLHTLVSYWINQRPAVKANNQRITSSSLLLVGEVDEIQMELDKPELLIKQIDRFLETIDAFWVALGIAFQAQLPIQVMEIDAKLAMNGAAGHSNIFDHLKEVAGNLTESSLQKDLTYFLSLALSHLADHDLVINYDIFSLLVLIKNTGNYEEVFLSTLDVHSGKILETDALNTRYFQMVVLLKIIRNGLIKLGQTDIKRSGMLPEDWQPYTDILHDTPQGDLEKNAVKLQQLVENRVIDPQVQQTRVEERDIRLVDHKGRKIL